MPAAEVAKPTKKEYTDEEFRKAVDEEVQKQLKKVANNKLSDFSKELLQKEDSLKLKELELKKQEDSIKNNSADFEKRLKEFQDSQKKLIGCVDSQTQQSEKRVDHMVEIVSGMKPQSAADVLAVQEPDLAVQILAKLDATKVSKIFNLMEKEVSARLQKQYMTMKK